MDAGCRPDAYCVEIRYKVGRGTDIRIMDSEAARIAKKYGGTWKASEIRGDDERYNIFEFSYNGYSRVCSFIVNLPYNVTVSQVHVDYQTKTTDLSSLRIYPKPSDRLHEQDKAVVNLLKEYAGVA